MKQSYLYFIILFYQINSIIENPIFLVDSKNPYVLSVNDNNSYYIIAKGMNLKVKKKTGKRIASSSNEVEEGCFFTHDFSYKNYLLCSDKYYIINNSNNFLYEKYEYNSLVKNCIDPTTIVGSMINKNNDDIYIYGYSANQIYFLHYFIEHQNFPKDSVIGMSCKFIEDNYFICGKIVLLKLYVYNFKINIDFSIEPLLTLLPDESSDYLYFDSISSLGLYDTDKNNIKLLCRQRNQEINCYFIKITTNEESSIELIGDENIVFTTSNDFTEKNCYFSEFNNQYLFCCGIKDMIKCYIIKKDIYTILNKFKISMLGDNSYLTIKINNGCTNLFFMNANNNINNVYGYYICIPECNTKFYRIVNSLNEDGDNGKLNDLVNIKTNNYYFEIIDNIDDIGYFTLNDEKLKQRHLINPFRFIPKFEKSIF